MKVADSMTRDVRACSVHDSLNAAARVMWENDCGCVPIVDSQGRLVGIVTDRDICMATYTQGVPLEDVQFLAGHSSPTTTRIYDRRRPARDAQHRGADCDLSCCERPSDLNSRIPAIVSTPKPLRSTLGIRHGLVAIIPSSRTEDLLSGRNQTPSKIAVSR